MEEINWQTFEYIPQDKSVDWYWIIWILAIGIAVTAYLFNNLLFGILILISAFSLSLYASRKPDLLNFILSERGLHIGSKFFPFKNLKSFWVEEEERKIIFQAQNKTTPLLVVPFSPKVDRDHLREYLLKRLKEVEQHETLSQKIMEKLGF